jgi:hypothetical protein
MSHISEMTLGRMVYAHGLLVVSTSYRGRLCILRPFQGRPVATALLLYIRMVKA